MNPFAELLHMARTTFGLIKPNDTYNPRMVQAPLIQAGNTGRYVLDAFQIAFNSPAGGGTLAPNSPATSGPSLDVTTRQYARYGGMGTIPNTPTTQGLVRGFRDKAI